MTTPTVKLPPGFRLEEDADGNMVVVPTNEPMSKTVAFRLPASTYAEMIAYVEATPEKTWGSAMRQLLHDDRVRAVIAEYITMATRPRRR